MCLISSASAKAAIASSDAKPFFTGRPRDRPNRKQSDGVGMARRLADTHRKLSKEWHPTRNEGLTPRDVNAGSSKKVWWQCPIDIRHVWQTMVANRTKTNATGCPFCSGHRVTADRTLAALHPELAAEWHPTKNGELTPSDVAARSGKKMWWVCDAGPDHVWRTQVFHRTRNGSGCPCCAGRQASVTNSLAALHPELAAQWHPEKNGSLRPEDVPAGSQRKVWWTCDEGPDHHWQAQVNSRVRLGVGCPFCAGRRASVTNSLAKLYPHIALQLDPDRNGDLRPEDIPVGSHRQVWWRCSAGPDHQWQTLVSSRTSRDSGCPFCSRHRVSVTNSLAELYPEIAAEWHPTKNGDLTPEDVVPGSNRSIWWRCAADPGHEWQTKPSSRTAAGSGCPFCAGKLVTPERTLATLFPVVAALWHPERNAGLTPDDVAAHSNRRVWWRCELGPDHEWEGNINLQVKNVNSCPFCSGFRVSKTNSLATLYPAIAKHWCTERNRDLRPQQVTARTKRKIWWRCPKGPDHVWQTTVYYRTQRSSSCPFCTGRRVSVTNSLKTLFPKVAREWDTERNGDLTPGDVLAAANQRYWWRCALGHVWQAAVRDRTAKRRGCPQCARGW